MTGKELLAWIRRELADGPPGYFPSLEGHVLLTPAEQEKVLQALRTWGGQAEKDEALALLDGNHTEPA